MNLDFAKLRSQELRLFVTVRHLSRICRTVFYLKHNMLSLFGLKPRCPVSFDERIWLERRMRWLRNQLGQERLERCVVRRPCTNEFPELNNHGSEVIQPLFDRLVNMMEVQQPVSLEVVPDDPLATDAGTYQNTDGIGHIHIRKSVLADPLKLIAVLAHELSHAILLGENHLDDSEPDMELLTDLGTVFCGFGIFGANACLRESYEQGTMYYAWKHERLGYMSSPQFGYALALLCWLRQEGPASWISDLRLDARETLSRGLKYLRKSDSKLLFEQQPSNSGNLISTWENRLKTGSDALHCDTLMDIANCSSELPESLLSLVYHDTHHQEDSIALLALGILARHSDFISQHLEDLTELLFRRSPPICIATLQAFVDVPRSPEFLATVVSLFHHRRDHSVRISAVQILIGHGASLSGENLENELLREVRTALLNHDRDSAVLAIKLIDDIADDASAVIRERFGHTEDDEWLAESLECLTIARQGDQLATPPNEESGKC